MAEPDVRVDPAELGALGEELAATGEGIGAAGPVAGAAIVPDPAWMPGFDSVAAGAALAEAGLAAARAAAAEAGACAEALRATAASWTGADDAAAAALRDG